MMNSLLIAFAAFACMFGAVLLGGLVHKYLPKHHLSSETKDVIKLGVALVATQAALVLGLLISSAKSTLDSTNNGLVESATKIILVDHVLSCYGPETNDVRLQLRRVIASIFDKIWPKNHGQSRGISAIEGSNVWERMGSKLQTLTPRNDAQRFLKTQALQLAGELTRLRWMLIEQAHEPIPAVFLVVLVFWFTVLFAIFGTLTPSNLTLNMAMLVCTLSIAGGILMVLEMNQPLEGMIKASGAPLQNALDHLGESLSACSSSVS